MRDRRVLSALTMAVLTVILVVGAVVGFRTLFAPLPGAAEDDEAASPTAAQCKERIRAGRPVRSRQVTVSVYNASNRSGLAGETRDQLTERGFLPGEAGNAPEEYAVQFVRVLAPRADDPAALLVAAQFGPDTFVQVTEDDIGPGVDVIVGPDYPGVVEGAPQRMEAVVDGSGC